MENNWWHEDHEEEEVRWFEIEEDELMDGLLDFDIIFRELNLDFKGLPMDDIIEKWFNTMRF